MHCSGCAGKDDAACPARDSPLRGKTTLQHELRQTLDRSPVGVDAPAVEWNETLQIIQEVEKRCKNRRGNIACSGVDEARTD